MDVRRDEDQLVLKSDEVSRRRREGLVGGGGERLISRLRGEGEMAFSEALRMS